MHQGKRISSHMVWYWMTYLSEIHNGTYLSYNLDR